MTRMELPNAPGDFNIDGISIVILPTKIIVDTGNRQTRADGHQNNSAYTGKKHSGGKNGEPKKPKKDGDMWNNILDNCENIVMGRKKV